MLARELHAERADGVNHDDLELVGDLRHEAGYLLHEAVDAALVARLEQGGDGECGYGAVLVGDKVLQVEVAGGDGSWVADGDLVEGLDGGVAQGGLRGGAEELEDADGGGELFGRGGGQGDDGGGGLVDDHVGLVAQAGLDEVEEARLRVVLLLLELVGGDADEKAVGVRRLEGGA